MIELQQQQLLFTKYNSEIVGRAYVNRLLTNPKGAIWHILLVFLTKVKFWKSEKVKPAYLHNYQVYVIK